MTLSKLATPFLVLLVFLSGCHFLQSREGYADVNDAYIAVLEGLIAAQQEGKFSNEEWRDDIVPLLILGDQLLDTYNAVTKAGGDAPETLSQLREVLLALNQYLTSKDFFASG